MYKKEFLISKSKYVECYSCPLKLWLHKHKPDIKEELSLSEQLNMMEGVFVGEIATTLNRFKNGKKIPTNNKSKAVEITKKELTKNNKILYEASFRFDIAFCQADILVKDGEFIDLYEVKASNKVKNHHLIDIAFQKWIVEKNGYKVRNTYLVHFNSKYTFNESLDLENLFELELVNSDITIYFNEVEAKLEEMKKVLANPMEPKFQVGGHCKSPYACPFSSYCNKSVNEDHVENLSNLSDKKRKLLNEKNIKYIKDIPKEFELTPKQQIQANCAIDNKVHFNKALVKEFLSKLKYPLFHLDFEAMNQSIPCYKNMSPNQFIVYQASIHREEKNGTIDHKEKLITKKIDGRKEMIDFLIKNLETNGSIIVWNKSFEATRIKELAKQFLEFEKQLLSLVERMVDIRDIFSQNMIYSHAFQGSSSIKYVLPVICPTLSYDRLFIRNGNDSQAYYVKMINGEFKGGMYHKIKKALLEYNKLDTFAMLEILRKVIQLSKMKEVVL
jgi:CRISPR/Cas system-associated exonuclease Cas4 (RecB family)